MGKNSTKYSRKLKMIILEDKLIEKLKSELKSSDKVIKFKDLSNLQK